MFVSLTRVQPADIKICTHSVCVASAGGGDPSMFYVISVNMWDLKNEVIFLEKSRCYETLFFIKIIVNCNFEIKVCKYRNFTKDEKLCFLYLFLLPINLNFFLFFFCQPLANVLPSLSIYDPSFCRVFRPGWHQSALFFSFPGDWTRWTGSRAFRREKSLWLAVQLSLDEKTNRKRKPVTSHF